MAHKSLAKVRTARSRATAATFAEADRIFKLAARADAAGMRGDAKRLYSKARRLYKRSFASGRLAGPVGVLPNPKSDSAGQVDVIRYYVSPGHAMRGYGSWYVKGVRVNDEGREESRNAISFKTKRDAKHTAAMLNDELKRLGRYRAINPKRETIAEGQAKIGERLLRARIHALHVLHPSWTWYDIAEEIALRFPNLGHKAAMEYVYEELRSKANPSPPLNEWDDLDDLDEAADEAFDLGKSMARTLGRSAREHRQRLKLYTGSYYSKLKGKQVSFIRPIEAHSATDAKAQIKAMVTNEKPVNVTVREVKGNPGRNKLGRNYEKAIKEAEAAGVNFDADFHAQHVGGTLAAMAKRYGYRAPRNASGSTGRYFFELLKRARDRQSNPSAFVCAKCGAPVTPMGNVGHWRKAHPGEVPLKWKRQAASNPYPKSGGMKPLVIRGKYVQAMITRERPSSKFTGMLISFDGQSYYPVGPRGRSFKLFRTLDGAKKWGHRTVAEFDRKAEGRSNPRAPASEHLKRARRDMSKFVTQSERYYKRLNEAHARGDQKAVAKLSYQYDIARGNAERAARLVRLYQDDEPKRSANPWACLECGRTFRSAAAAEKAAFGDEGCPGCGSSDIDNVSEAEVKQIKESSRANPGLVDLAAGLQAVDYLGGKLAGKRKRNAGYEQERCANCTHVVGWHDALVGKCFAPVDDHYCPCGKFVRRKRNAADQFEVSIYWPGHDKATYGAEAGGLKKATQQARSLIRQGALEVVIRNLRTGERVHFDKSGASRSRKRNAGPRPGFEIKEGPGTVVLLKDFWGHRAGTSGRIVLHGGEYQLRLRGSQPATVYQKDVDTLFRYAYARKRNPSLHTLSETFQGRASGAVKEYKASNAAPANLARVGRLVFFEVNGKRIRLAGVTVAMDTRERLWLAGSAAPLFMTKAKRGQRLDYGSITRICYETAKAHIERGKRTEYDHEFERPYPRLQIDDEGMPIIVGGRYKIRAEGITG